MGTQMMRYNESVDTFAYALVLLCLAIGDIHYVLRATKESCSGAQCYVGGWRPSVPDTLRNTMPELVELIEACWHQDFRVRPTMRGVVVSLNECDHHNDV